MSFEIKRISKRIVVYRPVKEITNKTQSRPIEIYFDHFKPAKQIAFVDWQPVLKLVLHDFISHRRIIAQYTVFFCSIKESEDIVME